MKANNAFLDIAEKFFSLNICHDWWDWSTFRHLKRLNQMFWVETVILCKLFLKKGAFSVQSLGAPNENIVQTT